jgi:hypothetical protein
MYKISTFPIGFYSNPHPLWTPQNMTLTPFTHNTAKIQHCPISKFDMWVDNDVPNWFPTLKNLYRSPFSKWPPQFRTNSSLSDFNVLNWFRDIIIYPHIKFWYRTMLNFCGIVATILKMATCRNCSMSGHHYLPTYKILMIKIVRFQR